MLTLKSHWLFFVEAVMISISANDDFNQWLSVFWNYNSHEVATFWLTARKKTFHLSVLLGEWLAESWGKVKTVVSVSSRSLQDNSVDQQRFCIPFSLHLISTIAAGFPLQLIVKSSLSYLWITLRLITHTLPPLYTSAESQFVFPRLQFLLFIVWKWVCIKMKRNHIVICLELAWTW